MTRTRNKDGIFYCTACDGSGEQEFVRGPHHPSDPFAPSRVVPCIECDGSGLAACVDCGQPASIEGADGRSVYCGVEHAYSDENWPACVSCRSEPQSVLNAPFCSTGCASRMRDAAIRAMEATP